MRRLNERMAAVVVLCGLWTLAAAGCGSAPVKYTPGVLSQLRTKLQAKTMVIKPFTADPSLEESAGPTASCREATMKFIQEKAVFKQVLADPPATMEDVVMVDAHVTSLRIVSGAARFWGGAFAGSSEMSVTVKLTDGATGAQIVEKAIDSATNAMGAAWTGGATDRSLPYDMGGIIGEYVIDTLGGPVKREQPQE